MSRKDIKFSVIIPVYNAEKYIEACIESVLNQSYQNFELILVNDGSSDNSGDICSRYADKITNVFAYHKENSGVIHTRRYALERAIGDYCVFVDADDSLKKDTLQILHDTIRKYECDCVIYGYDRVQNGTIVNKSQEETETCITDKRMLYRKCFFSSEYNQLCRKAVKRSVFKRVDYSSYYHISRGEDLLQSIDVLENSTSVVFIKDRLYNYTLNPNSITEAVKYESYELSFEVRQEVLNFLKTQMVFEEQDWRDYRTYCLSLIHI